MGGRDVGGRWNGGRGKGETGLFFSGIGQFSFGLLKEAKMVGYVFLVLFLSRFAFSCLVFDTVANRRIDVCKIGEGWEQYRGSSRRICDERYGEITRPTSRSFPNANLRQFQSTLREQ